MKEKKFSLGVWAFSPCGDRFLTIGYRPEMSLEKVIREVATIDDLSGVEVGYPGDVNENNLDYFREIIKETGLVVSMVGVDLTGDRKWQNGSLSSTNPEIRKEAVETCRSGIEVAKQLGCDLFNIWLGQDGYDYPFQSNYPKAWDLLVDSIKEVAKTGVKVCLEYKPKEPRTHSYIATVGKALLIAHETGKSNVGVTIDVGHALAAYESMAESAVLCMRDGRLFHLHLNDNYRLWDDDMIVGSVHTIEYLELIYWLEKIGYDGWYSLDIYPYRENPLEASRESIEMLKTLSKLLDKIGRKNLEKAIEEGNPAKIQKLLREKILQ
ncbi:MAG: sugar phosphate isomerase/epimerase family protein [Candidatus Jordarchaeum sp.]|uniref:sugar phosphate isomerase/epimerase family protein n=1 Tax=Candidatus Jordarchaeum sp. TaxID=2823881 RepID=UPI00404B14AF